MNIDRKYTAKYLGSGTGNRTVVGIVLHDTAGSGTINDVKYLANPSDGREVSVDFCVARDGSVYQLSPNLSKHWTNHAGRATKFKGLKNENVNHGTIGIEIVQKADLSLSPLYPAAQVKAVAELCAHLCEKFSLKQGDITTHAKVITDGSRSDPRQFPFSDFWANFASAGNAGSTGGAPPTTHTVKQGDTLFGIAKKYKTTIERVKMLNGMNTASNVIKIGQVLKISG